MKFFIFIVLLAAPFLGRTQTVEVSAPQSEYDSTRSYYIKHYSDHFNVWPVFKARGLDFRLEDLPDRQKRLTYRSNRSFVMGVGLYIFEVVLEITAAVPLYQRSEYIYGKSDAKDIQVNLFGKRWGVDAYRQKYEGFYVSDPAVDVPAHTPFPQRQDITTSNLGTTISYTLNNKKFSFRSAYNYSERQLRSSGSFVFFTSISRFKVKGDSSVVGNRYTDEFGADAKIAEFKSFNVSLAPAYTYSLIYKRFFINGTIAVGPGHNWLSLRTEDNETRTDTKFTTFFLARVAIGYNGDRFFGGASFVSQGNNTRYDSVNLLASNGMLKIMFGYRFREFGFLKKRLVDLPKAMGIGR